MISPKKLVTMVEFQTKKKTGKEIPSSSAYGQQLTWEVTVRTFSIT